MEVTWSHKLDGSQVPGRPRSEDFACVWRQRETTFLFQRISVLLFRFNSVLLHNSFELDDRLEHWPLHSILTFSIFSYPRFSRV